MNGKKGLGRGLEALISIGEESENDVKNIKINEIEPNKSQPRKIFNDDKLNELAKSIEKHGIVQPIIVQKEKNSYRIIAGERRWRAAKIAGIKTVPAIIKDFNEHEIIEVALIENLQREDLNPIEEAKAYEKLIREFKKTQEEISEIIGKSRSTIANSIRLLGLTEEVRDKLLNGQLTSGHGRALLGIDDKDLQIKIAEEIIEEKYSVRETEKIIKTLNDSSRKKRSKKETDKDPEIINLEESLQRILGTKVRLNHSEKNGKIVIEYYSKEELERIIEMIKRVV
jgi:ParB family chromosome partitioning protein